MFDYETYNLTEAAIMRAQGLATALNSLATDSTALNNPDPTCHAILTLIDTLSDTVDRIADLHQEAWNKAAKPAA